MENWVIKNKAADFNRIMQQCSVSEVLARCLVNKGLVEPEDIMAYLHPDLSGLHNPFLLKDMDKACEILMDKIKSGKKIRIIGDYDVDGVVATYVLYNTLRKLEANVDYEIPDRIKDGYGININMVEAAYNDKVDTLLTCDNGIVAMEQVHRAKEYNMTVIITDHHSLAQVNDSEILLPEADAIINPKQPDCNYPYTDLCGAAIAYKLVMALLTHYEIADKDAYINELLSYIAIATVCDVMDLTGENRIIVKHGLKLLRCTLNKGLLALMDVAGIDKEQLSAFHLGFVIGPCLNASGRLDTAKRGLELLLSDSKEEAVKLAEDVRNLNDVRKEMTAENVEKCVQLIEEGTYSEDKILVVYLPDCHESIAGIIAGRIRERYNKPTIILTDAHDSIKGSGRSIEHYNMIEEIMKCKELLLKAGGHPMAAGLSLLQSNIEPFRQALNKNTTLTDEMLIPKVTIDIKLPLGLITEDLVNELKLLEPFGKGNEKPLFAEKDLKIKSAFIIGKNASGIRLRVENTYGREMDAVYFGDVEAFFSYIGSIYGQKEAENLRTGRGTKVLLTITYYPKINEYNGFKSIQLMIQNYR
ncbi:MAG TPA: single-stranded-DNA-specific exonuclease RecJ [Mobilitalea sp.]|nr:single-stranded-DNA-specific exonuclease RecJ [Mobilitalea sp.]